MSWRLHLRTVALVGLGCLCAAASARGDAFTWTPAAPESQGLDPAAVEQWRGELARRRTKALLVVRHDRIVCAWYAADVGPTTALGTASLAKALVGGMSLLVALDDGRLTADDLASKFIPVWRDDLLRSRITIRHLATHSSGIEDAEEDGKAHDALTGWKGDFWKRQPDPFSIAVRQAPVVFEPGPRFAYSNPGMAALAYAVTASLHEAPQTDLHTLLKDRILDPIGVPAKEWSIGYGQAYDVDGLKLYANWGGARFSARAAARVGRLMLRKGDWDGKQIIRAEMVQRMLTYANTPLSARTGGEPEPASGLCWWLNSDGVWPQVPRDAFAGAGAGHQVLLVVPSLDLIVVRFGETLAQAGDGSGFWRPVEHYLFNPLMAAITDAPKPTSAATTSAAASPPAAAAPYPPSPIIRAIDWAPPKTIVRKANDSDNWPMTWADDDHLYTAYGDGRGFEPYIADKLSLGLARVEGPAEAFTGVNLRSADIEQKGSGRKGVKASGMVMVEGVLYLAARNAGNARLASSADHGRTWRWADWRFTTSFGCPTFLNFGRNYAGARDRYVYLYSFDSDSAYDPADRMVLARVPQDRIMDRVAYEFFVRVDDLGQPEWSADIARRGAVFTHPGHCYRSGVTYAAGLRRYLWVQVLPTEPGPANPKAGLLAVYDAPEPWGPWTTAYFAQRWDVNPGETASFPTKWMSPDGQTLHLVFSGEDSFAVRRATIRR